MVTDLPDVAGFTGERLRQQRMGIRRAKARFFAGSAELRDWLKEGAKDLQDMAAEEVAEMMSELQSLAQQSAGRDMALADKPGDLAAKGAKFCRRSRKARPRRIRPSAKLGDHLASYRI